MQATFWLSEVCLRELRAHAVLALRSWSIRSSSAEAGLPIGVALLLLDQGG